MKIDYIRNLMASHMVIEQSEELEDWEREMILHSQVDGILFAECIREDEKENLWYDITGKQALDVFLDSAAINYGMLCRFLLGLYEAAEKLESFLLRTDALLLEPECIFVTHKMEQVYFCYYPGSVKEPSGAFSALMEYLLTRLDHGDVQAVELAYGIYEQAIKEGFSLLKLRELFCVSYEKDEKVKMQEPEKNGAYSENGELQARCETDGYAGLEQYSATENSVNLAKNKNRSAAKQKLAKLFQRVREAKGGFCAGLRFREKKNNENFQNEPFVFEPEEETELRQARPTVLLTEITKHPEGILRYEGDGAGRDLKVCDTPYIIGSEENCDGYIPSSTVSRRHARITRVEEIYFIEDLNSSNGTCVGGELLKMRL